MADATRGPARSRVLALAPGERVALAHRLAASDLDAFCAARQIDPDEARRLLARLRQTGRRPSGVTGGRTP